MRRGQYNAAKKRALQLFADRGGWMYVHTFADLAGVQPVRRAFTYLLRLHNFGLLDRAKDASGKLIYRITEQGRQRLRFWAAGT